MASKLNGSVKTWATIIATIVIVSGLIGQGCVAIYKTDATAAELTRYQEQVRTDNEKYDADIAEIRVNLGQIKETLASMDTNIEWLTKDKGD